MTIANEVERQFYLGKTGIRLWYARGAQPGAAPSPVFDFGESQSVESSICSTSTASVIAFPEDLERAANLTNLKNLVKGDAGEAPERQSKPQGGESGKESPAVAESDRLDGLTGGIRIEPDALPDDELTDPLDAMPAPVLIEAYWGFWVTERYLFVSALSLDVSDQLQQGLAQNILLAMGSEVKSTRVVNWPVFNNPLVPGNDESGFRSVLHSLRQAHPQLELIALGLCQGDEWPERCEWLRDALGEPALDFEHSLAAVAADPHRKKTLWQKLRLLSGQADV
jgi:hypothetical protein